MITRTHTPSRTHSVFPKHNAEKTRLTPFSKNYFFCSLLLLLTPETLPNHLFRQTNDQKWLKKLPKRTKINFLFFYKLFHIFPLPLRKKTKPLTFSALFITEIGKPQGKRHIKIFFLLFFLLFCILPLRVIVKITTYLFFSKFRLKVPKTAVSALKFHFLQNTFFPP